MSPVFDIDPGQSPEAPGTLSFFKQGSDPSTGMRITSEGEMIAPGNSALTWPPAEFQPSDYGFQGWAFDPALCTGGTIAVNGGVYLTKVPVRKAGTSVAVHWAVTTAGATPTAGQNEVGVFGPDGTRLGAVNVDAQISATGAKRSLVAAACVTPFVWVGFVFNAATPPTLGRPGSFESTPNANLAAAVLRFAKNGSAATALPASVVPASNTSSGALNWWAAIE